MTIQIVCMVFSVVTTLASSSSGPYAFMEDNCNLVASFIFLLYFKSGHPSWCILVSKACKADWGTNGHDLLKSLSLWSLAGLLEEEEAMALQSGTIRTNVQTYA